MRRTPSAADGHSESPARLVSRISAPHRSPSAAIGRHRRIRAVEAAIPEAAIPEAADLAAADSSNVTRERSLVRRLAPLAVGAAAMLVVTAIATVVPPPADDVLAGPDLAGALVTIEPTTARRPAPVSPNVSPTTSATTSAPPATTAGAAPSTEHATTQPTRRAEHRPSPAPAPRHQVPAPAPAGPSAGRGDDTQAATRHGWTLVGGDEFNGAKSSLWGEYTGPGHAGNGRRTSDAISVEDGSLVIRGDAAGTTGGMAWQEGQRFGRWEVRARFPSGDDQYHPVLILWPTDVDWPRGGEIDFAETTSASDNVSFFLHHGADNQQSYARKDIDISQWHHYAVEWVHGRITGYIDGERWFESTDSAAMPPGRMHPTIQLDYFPSGGSPRPTAMYVDYMRVYK